MKKAVFWGLGAVAAVGLMWWFYSMVMNTTGSQWRDETYWRGWQKEAAGDGYYLAKQLLRRHHNRIITPGAYQQRLLPAHGVLVWGDGSGKLSAAELRRLKTWLEQGGTLLLSEQSALAAALGASARKHAAAEKTGKAIFWQERGEESRALAAFPGSMPCVHLHLRLSDTVTGAVRDAAGCEYLLRFAVGRGAVVLWAAHFHQVWRDKGAVYRNRPADETDIPILTPGYAGLLHALTGDSREVLWLLQQKHPRQSFDWQALRRWLAAFVVPAVLFLCLLIALLWRFGTRLGSVLELQRQAESADLSRHFAAAGRLVCHAGGKNFLLAAARQRLRAQLPGQYQALADNPEALVTLLQQHYGISSALTHRAFFYTAEDFVRLMQDIETVRSIIERGKL